MDEKAIEKWIIRNEMRIGELNKKGKYWWNSDEVMRLEKGQDRLIKMLEGH